MFANDHSAGSRVVENEGIKIQMESIDNVLQGGSATFIKMDVEGSELKSLIGAKHTIQKYKPRMAISIYHKPEDIITIPDYILRIRSDYNFKVRQYMSDADETVLYAY